VEEELNRSESYTVGVREVVESLEIQLENQN